MLSAGEKTYMLNNIFLKFSEFAMLGKEEHPFSNKYGATAEAILTEYGIDGSFPGHQRSWIQAVRPRLVHLGWISSG